MRTQLSEQGKPLEDLRNTAELVLSHLPNTLVTRESLNFSSRVPEHSLGKGEKRAARLLQENKKGGRFVATLNQEEERQITRVKDALPGKVPAAVKVRA